MKLKHRLLIAVTNTRLFKYMAGFSWCTDDWQSYHEEVLTHLVDFYLFKDNSEIQRLIIRVLDRILRDIQSTAESYAQVEIDADVLFHYLWGASRKYRCNVDENPYTIIREHFMHRKYVGATERYATYGDPKTYVEYDPEILKNIDVEQMFTDIKTTLYKICTDIAAHKYLDIMNYIPETHEKD